MAMPQRDEKIEAIKQRRLQNLRHNFNFFMNHEIH